MDVRRTHFLKNDARNYRLCVHEISKLIYVNYCKVQFYAKYVNLNVQRTFFNEIH